jgi:hypothetical protein
MRCEVCRFVAAISRRVSFDGIACVFVTVLLITMGVVCSPKVRGGNCVLLQALVLAHKANCAICEPCGGAVSRVGSSTGLYGDTSQASCAFAAELAPRDCALEFWSRA